MHNILWLNKYLLCIALYIYVAVTSFKLKFPYTKIKNYNIIYN